MQLFFARIFSGLTEGQRVNFMRISLQGDFSLVAGEF
jgi:hypothetical protein